MSEQQTAFKDLSELRNIINETDGGTENPEALPEKPTVMQRLDKINGDLVGTLQSVWDVCHRVARENLEISDLNSECHQFVKYMNEHDKLVDLADIEAMEMILRQYADSIQPELQQYRRAMAITGNKHVEAVYVKFVKEGEEVVARWGSRLVDFPETPDPEEQVGDQLSMDDAIGAGVTAAA